jgi:starch phosphorylase
MIDSTHMIARAQEKARLYYQQTLQSLGYWQLHQVLGEALMEDIAPVWQATSQRRQHAKQAFYISAEYLLGRLIFNNLYCAGVLEEVAGLLQDRGIDINSLEDVEDAAFGNGGLGRLAACYLDSAAAHDIPLMGYGLRYRFGLFKQKIVDYAQVEEPDDWSRFGDPFGIRRYDLRVTVNFRDQQVVAVPYDMPVIGYEMKSVGTLRLWQAESPQEVDFALFNRQQYVEASADKNKAEDLTKFLYPNDSGEAGRLMRIKQEYLLSSATVQDMLRSFVEKHGRNYSRLPALCAIQLNDTHPVMAIPELIRLLQADGLDFEEAFQIARNTFSYTNHTVMQEALEKWDALTLKRLLPEMYAVIRRINQRLLGEVNMPSLSCIRSGNVHMADLAVYASHTVNGVARIHSQILKDHLFKDWYALYPERFQNVTNGVTQRRWLALCNPELASLVESVLGDRGFVTDLERLNASRDRITDGHCYEFMRIKGEKKRQLAQVILQQEGILIPEHFLFDVQVKRLHEYKRQLLNALSIMAIYQGLKDGSINDFTPTAFIFGAKAAPGYARAKAIIRYINQLAELINGDPAVKDKLRVVFVQNYNCSYAEHIIPAADVSEQISPAGTEASGTGNMKLMLNGAVTLGTFDGANVEIVEEAGLENNYIFGATVEQIEQIRSSYQPREYYHRDKHLKRAVDSLIDGTFKDIKENGEGSLHELHTSLLEGAAWHKPDHYFLMLDFEGYYKAKLQVNQDYKDRLAFARKCLHNVFSAGKFTSDRSVKEYARNIWQLEEPAQEQ